MAARTPRSFLDSPLEERHADAFAKAISGVPAVGDLTKAAILDGSRLGGADDDGTSTGGVANGLAAASTKNASSS
jgi:hypothetical protein